MTQALASFDQTPDVNRGCPPSDLESPPAFTADNTWQPVMPLPFPSWQEAVKQVEKKLRKDYAPFVSKVSLWFAPMPLEAVYQRGDTIRLHFLCTSRHRKEEVERLQSLLQEVLAGELFPGKQVLIVLVEQFEDTPTPSQTKDDGSQVLSKSPVRADSLEKDGDHEKIEEPEAPSTPPAPSVETQATDQETLESLRRRLGSTISDEDLRVVIKALQARSPNTPLPSASQSRSAEKSATEPVPSILTEILVEPSYATTYDEIVRDHAAVYLPAYFVRHLRHMGPADGLRYMALRQIAYRHGIRDAQGTHLLPATAKELSRWSSLQPRRILGGLEDSESYLFLLAGKIPFIDYYASRPEANRWEDAAGFHWKANGREFCIWKNNGAPTNECSQLMADRFSGEPQWRRAPLVYRVQLSMPLCPEDENALREALIAFGVREDPLNAIRQCLELPRDDIIPDRPAKLITSPKKLRTVQELVIETWGRPGDRELAARVAVQSKLLETHLIQGDRDLLKIPLYLLEKWGPYLSPAQLWTAIIAMDRVYAGREDGQYRDTTTLLNGIKEMTLWTEDEYSKGASRKISKWLYPFNISSDGESDATKDAAEHFNPWFSVFVSENLSETEGRIKNADNSVQMKLRVLPVVPLCPEDTLAFSKKMGLDRLAVRDASGKMLALEITDEELAVYLPDGRTLRYSYRGELRYGNPDPVVLQVRNRQLDGMELLISDDFYESETWPGALFGMLEKGSGALFGDLEIPSGAFSGVLENGSGALFGNMALDPGALFGALLKLLILNLYGIKTSSSQKKTPSTIQTGENVDSLEQFGSRQGQFMQWMGVPPESDWDFYALVRSLGISDVKSLQDQGVTANALVATVFELYAIPTEKFTNSRIAVLVSKLRSNPIPKSGAVLRLAELGPDQIQDYLRRAIISLSPVLNDPDWDQTLGRAKRNDLIELVERLGLGQVIRMNRE